MTEEKYKLTDEQKNQLMLAQTNMQSNICLYLSKYLSQIDPLGSANLLAAHQNATTVLTEILNGKM